MTAIISGKLVKLGASQNAKGGTELLVERLLKGTKKELLKKSAKKTERYRSVGDGIGNGFKKSRHALSSDYIIGQAYNKGNLQVLSKSDSADASTGKRR